MFLPMGLGSRFSLGCLKYLAMQAGVFRLFLALLSPFYCSYLLIDAYFGQLVLNCVLECRLHGIGGGTNTTFWGLFPHTYGRVRF